MSKKVLLVVVAVAALVLLIGVLSFASRPVTAAPPASVPMASSPSYQLNWEVVSNGGATMTSTTYTMYSTTGQTAVNNMSGSSYTVENGFWHGIFQGLYKLFVPMIQKVYS